MESKKSILSHISVFNCYKFALLPRYTLQTLKELDLQDFPMHKFIVEASSSVSPPKYLEEAEHTMKIRLRNNDERNFSPLIDHEWPTPEELGLDNNQFVAYKAAITREFAIIQGPPGTGKTFLGRHVDKY